MRRVLLGIYTYAEFFLAALLFVPVLGLVALLHRGDPACRIRGRWMRRFGRFTSALTPLWRFSVRGEAPPGIREGRAFVVVANHESTADPFLLSWLPWDMRWVAKVELFRLPLIGLLMRAGGDIPLRRGSRESAEEMLEACRRTLAAGVPVMLFPEGTRSPDGNLLPFKDGAFRLALEAGVPILPVALAGTRNCRPKGSLWFGDARAVAQVLEPIPTEGRELAALREEARTRIGEAAARLRSELDPGGERELRALHRVARGASGR
ncbi:lysophospholipid acyltransferase family protein [Vulgatibacter sp.]|uniref:lysophospholipid acyltransferase family protein n=1 Tax=Vulgatibacter sp. TaxID=1971226 RepID=UPI00356B05E7